MLIENVTIVAPRLQAPKMPMNVLVIDRRMTKITSKKITLYDFKIYGLGKLLTLGLWIAMHKYNQSLKRGLVLGLWRLKTRYSPKLIMNNHQNAFYLMGHSNT